MFKKINNFLNCMMRKLTVILLMAMILVIAIALCACGGGNASNGKSLYDHGLDVISLMSEASGSEEYVGAYTGNPEIMEIIHVISEGDYAEPKAVYSMTASEENLLAMLGVENISEISEELKVTLTNRALGAFTTQINGYSGVSELAASSVLTMGKTFVDSSLEENVIYIYIYENAVPVAVTFIKGEDSSVSASGTFVMYDAFTGVSAEEIETALSVFDVEVDVVK